MTEIKELLNESGGRIRITDLRILFQGIRIDYIVDGTNGVEFWAGNLDRDKYAECLSIDRQTAKTILEEVVEYMG